jgi:N-acetylmuramic acid 6-phosphate etherase
MDHLQTEARNPASANLSELTPLELVQLMNREDAQVIPAVASQSEAIARAIEVIAQHLATGGRLIYVGAGTSGRLGVLDATECPPTFNSPPGQVQGLIAGGPTAITQAVEGAEDRPELAERDLAAIGLSPVDVLVGIATSGRTPYVLGAMAYGRERGVFTIGLSCNDPSDLAGAVDLAITVVVGPEVLSGSTRLKAGTATKLVLNMLSTGAMVLLGKTYGNLMVDLRATNSKLKARTNRIVRLVTGIDTAAADRLLDACRSELKTALVVQSGGISPETARACLQKHGGRIVDVFKNLSSNAVQGDEPSKDTPLILGIDGGGTHTIALLAMLSEEGPRGWKLLGRGEAGPSNPKAVGATASERAILTAVAMAFQAAGRPRQRVFAACLGLAGAGRAEDQLRIRNWAERIGLASRVEVTTDVELLLSASTPSGWGLALVAGTGSIAFARHADGRTARAGGWGYLLSDEGSAYAIAVAGLRSVLCAVDGRGPATDLTERLLSRLNLSDPQSLVSAVHGGNLDRVALGGLAPLVIEAAQVGDLVATEICGAGSRELAEMAGAAARAVQLDRPFPIAFAGGLLVNAPYYRELVLNAMTALALAPASIGIVREPAEGALGMLRIKC